jgi:hypothetical protein
MNKDSFEINANEKDLIIIQRHLTKHTARDFEIQNLPIPQKPVWLQITIRLIRMYQKRISPALGNRCVFDPSCSRYSEMAFRKKETILTLQMENNKSNSLKYFAVKL